MGQNLSDLSGYFVYDAFPPGAVVYSWKALAVTRLLRKALTYNKLAANPRNTKNTKTFVQNNQIHKKSKKNHIYIIT